MNIKDLQRGDSFVEMPEHEYAALSRTQQRKLRVWTVDGKHGPALEVPRACPGNVHLRLEGAHWCVSAAHPVTRVERRTAASTESAA